MPRKRKYRKKSKGLLGELDWSMEPQAAREIIGVILVILGGLFLLSLFGVAGSFGTFMTGILMKLWGGIGYIVPLVFLFLGGGLLLDKIHLKASSVVGIILCFIFIPGLLAPIGGAIGGTIANGLRSLVGVYGAFLILLGGSIAAILAATNTSIKVLWAKLRGTPLEGEVKINEPKASVFATLRGKPQVSQQRPEPVMSAKGQIQWQAPSIELLETSTIKATSGNIAKNVEVIQKTLKDFGVEVSMAEVNIGPTVTQYTLKPSEGMKLAAITARTNDLALALAAHPIRIEAPIPGKALVGIEVPNKVPATVTLREILESDEFKKSKSTLSLALGRGVAGEPIPVDLAKMPHLLIAGATGSGKTISLNSIILSLLFRNSPADLRLILVDPKRVEFTPYNGIPHLLAPVITDVDKTVNTLRWAISEMDRRFQLFQETHRRDIQAYNQNPPDGKLPYIVIVIDELADLMAQAANEVESAIVRLAQMARATGIHLVVATQRPSVDVITGLIKANITSRIAFSVASQVDSRTILDQAGAERLLGNGDMLFISPDLGKPKRIQGCFASDKDTKTVADFLLKQGGPAIYDVDISDFRAAPGTAIAGGGSRADDSLYNEAQELVVQAGKASASLLQRRLRVGYARAARLLDILEENGVIGQAEGAKPRDVLVSLEELDMQKQASQQKPSSFGKSRPASRAPVSTLGSYGQQQNLPPTKPEPYQEEIRTIDREEPEPKPETRPEAEPNIKPPSIEPEQKSTNQPIVKDTYGLQNQENQQEENRRGEIKTVQDSSEDNNRAGGRGDENSA